METAFAGLVALLSNFYLRRNCSSVEIDSQLEEDPAWTSNVIVDLGLVRQPWLDMAVISVVVLLLVVFPLSALAFGCSTQPPREMHDESSLPPDWFPGRQHPRRASR